MGATRPLSAMLQGGLRGGLRAGLRAGIVWAGMIGAGIGLLLGPAAQAGEVLESRVQHQGGQYLIHLQMDIEAPAERVFTLLTDYAQLNRLSEAVVHSEVLARNGNQTRIRVVTRGCVLFYCRDVTQVQTATDLGRGYVMLVDDPEASDFQSGRTLWHIEPRGETTRVTLSAELQPGFWIPPLIGPALFKRKLLKEGTLLINTLEDHAQP
jgi:hypothetical protein